MRIRRGLHPAKRHSTGARRKLDHILQALHAAAPHAEIILVAFHNPFTVEVPGTDGLWHRYCTQAQMAAAARNGARFADVSDLLDDSDICEYSCTLTPHAV